MIQAILSDIEGTTSSISFVHDVLFPLSLNKMDEYLEESSNLPEINSALQGFIQMHSMSVKEVSQGIHQISEKLKTLIREDVKDTTLKYIQGKIWKQSFEKGEIKGHVYPEVENYFQQWTKEGKKIYIYSSGSVEAQKLLFSYSAFGDMTKYLSGYFDTTTGGKRERQSYEKIALAIQEPAQNILFLSDISEELQAAEKAGYNTCLLVRQGEYTSSPYKQAKDFKTVSELFFPKES